MIPPRIRAVYFDAVGTLIFPAPPVAHVYAAAGQRYGSRLTPAEIATRFRTAFQRSETNDLRTSEAVECERWRRIVGEVLDDTTDPEACYRELFARFGQPTAWRPHPEAAEVLAALAARGYALGLASNYDARLRSVVAGLPELRTIQHLVISSEVGWHKPAPEFFQAACARVGQRPEQVLHVGDDWSNDYQGAQLAGLSAVLLDATERELPSGTVRIRRLKELLAGEPKG